VGVNRPHQVFHRGFQFDCGDGFRDEFRGLWADDVHAQDFAVIGVGDNLDEASCWPTIDAREFAVKGNFPTLMLYPASSALASVKPTLPISGWQ